MRAAPAPMAGQGEARWSGSRNRASATPLDQSPTQTCLALRGPVPTAQDVVQRNLSIQKPPDTEASARFHMRVVPWDGEIGSERRTRAAVATHHFAATPTPYEQAFDVRVRRLSSAPTIGRLGNR